MPKRGPPISIEILIETGKNNRMKMFVGFLILIKKFVYRVTQQLGAHPLGLASCCDVTISKRICFEMLMDRPDKLLLLNTMQGLNK